MRDKKSKFVQVERKRFLLLEIGFILVLAVVLLAFNFRTYVDPGFLDFDRAPDNTIEELAPITVQTPPLPPPPAIEPPPATTLINIVDNNIDVDTEFVIDVEDDPFKEVEIFVPFIPEELSEPDDHIYAFPQQYPEFPGGEFARLKFLQDHTSYPVTAKEAGISGTVYISFIIETDGSITNIEVMRGPGGGLNREALRVAALMPKWKPGMQGGKKVRVAYNMPIKFVLQ